MNRKSCSPKNKSLYNSIKSKAKKKFKVWPSAYASGWLSKEYKKRGGHWNCKHTNGAYAEGRARQRKAQGSPKNNLRRWYKEKWIDACYYPKIVPCGRTKSNRKSRGLGNHYPYCRPLYRINKNTPKTVKELSKRVIKNRCSRKRKNPSKRVR